MSARVSKLTACAFALVLSLAAVSSAADAPARTVVVLLYDGWAPAMMNGVATPAMTRMRAEGSWTNHLEPVFPSLSLPNQVSISTGCWPASHGIVSNVFLDPERGSYDHAVDADWLTGCTHLHELAERHGIHAAALGWVGRFSTTRGDLATYVPREMSWRDYPDDDVRTEQVVELLSRDPTERPGLILAYFRGPDRVGHFTGLDSEETRAAVEASDRSVARILDVIDSLPDRDRIALLVTTDHGMLPVRTIINVSRVLENRDIEANVVSGGTTAFLYFSNGADIGRAAQKLDGNAAFDVFRKGELPPALHLGVGPRVPDLVLSAHPPYFIEDVKLWPWWARWLGRWGPEHLPAGLTLAASHGYPPDVEGMQGILYARGAGIPAGHEIARLRAIDVHPTVCRLLGIDPGDPVDGAVPQDLLPYSPVVSSRPAK